MLSIKDAALKDTGMKTFTIEAPAKINRYLKIVGVKDDKHLIETNFQSVSIYDKLSFEKIESGFENELVIKNNSEISQQIKIPTDSDNLVFKAFNFLNIKSGYRVYLEKNIPISAGLAGGSADAAGVLLAMEA
ncbi:MAG: hypothetical protein LBB10_00545, partial [Bifidobacteriaceae bacterium]|nr:hypothetical protein [Bifidobacteriaceae bacterium]